MPPRGAVVQLLRANTRDQLRASCRFCSVLTDALPCCVVRVVPGLQVLAFSRDAWLSVILDCHTGPYEHVIDSMALVNRGGSEGDPLSSVLSFSGAKGRLTSLASASRHFAQQSQGSPLLGIINSAMQERNLCLMAV